MPVTPSNRNSATRVQKAGGDTPGRVSRVVSAAGRRFKRATPPAISSSNPHAAKLRRIAARHSLKGFKGFCPVVLRDKRDLADSDPRFSSRFEGKYYSFSSAEAKKTFDAAPRIYAPANGGLDMVHMASGNGEIEGSLDHAAWFQNRLYLFDNAETKRAFTLDPTQFAVASQN